ncbi:hypothetical protein PRUPE_2G166300 [Prunus persica]|uniref:Leucine-rich repeat-containing N-terminal plant-type domain-containing protein n=1 Tax=Prunus persica TaxID=3760 RepID=A0A251QI04_PRUPE|nr:hypothetical protein PRUPE_2G166300 [Prunus persica]
MLQLQLEQSPGALQCTAHGFPQEAQKQDCCRWVGVSCSNQTGHVIQVDLHGLYSLQGKMISSKLIELHYLEHLDLGGINLIGISVPDFIGSLSNLRYLDLSWTYFDGKFPSEVGNLTNLQYLDLNFVNLSNVYDWSEAINKLPELTNLTLEGCDLPSPILSTLSYINSSSVVLSSNHLSTSSIFIWLSNYSTSHVHIDLSLNLLAGSIPDVFGNMRSLAHLDLSNNKLEGGALHSFASGQLSKFVEILLSTCAQNSLEILDLSWNHIAGSLPDLTKLSSLEHLYLNNNQLSGVISGIHLKTIQIIEFPKIASNSEKISSLDISDAKISDILPSWFWSLCRNVTFMKLARNEIGGTLVNLTFEFSYFLELRLSSNQLEGPIPSFLSKTSHLDLSYNKLSGSISFLCSSAAIGLGFLDLSNNNASRQVTDCLTYLTNLVMLDLSYNALSGKIPTTIGSIFWIETLKLRSNRFVGQLPSSLKNCTNLKFIDGYNKLSGPIPKWLGVGLKDLVILMLSSNHFNGSLPSQLCHPTHIQILNFSMNNISRSIPKCLNNLTTLAHKGNPSLTISHFVYMLSTNNSVESEYEDDATFIWKGRMYSYKNTLGLVKRIDLSRNRLTGEIPSEIAQLVGLVSLNLSRNQLTGHITPESMDALDLSRNHIERRIPTSLAQIYCLGFLDFSFNNLSGEIPIGTQLQSFDPSVYAGNPQLCGPPLKKMCVDQNVQIDLSNQEDDKDELITLGFYISMGLGFAAGF